MNYMPYGCTPVILSSVQFKLDMQYLCHYQGLMIDCVSIHNAITCVYDVKTKVNAVLMYTCYYSSTNNYFHVLLLMLRKFLPQKGIDSYQSL